jgi:hypothetical protein
MNNFNWKSYEDWTPYDDLAREEVREIFLEKEMQNYRKRALRKFSSMIPHPEFAMKVALSIVIGYRESIQESEDLIKDLDLCDMEICAIEENFDIFKKLYVIKFEDYICEVM